MWAEQAIFTSMSRRGREGYHLVSRSRGIDNAEAQELSRWAPSHGALIVDEANRVSVNYHPLADGRFCLSRTCPGPAEYSGRGGRQLYTHSLIFDEAVLGAVGFQPFALHRDAMAMGYFLFHPDPAETLEAVPLSGLHPRRDAGFWSKRAAALAMPATDPLRDRLESATPTQFVFDGDRAALAECLVGLLPPELVRRTSFSTSLLPSSARPFVLSLIDAKHGQQGRFGG